MLNYLFTWLQRIGVPGAGLMEYISFRSAMAFVVALILAIPLGKHVIRFLQKRQFGEEIRDLGLEGQLQKQGTPTMGGIIIVIATLLPTLLFADLTNIYIIIMLISLLWLCALGMADDLLKKHYRNKRGLNGWLKVLFQGLLGIVVALCLYLSPQAMVRDAALPKVVRVELQSPLDVQGDASPAVAPSLEKNLKTTIPFFKNNELDYRKLIPLSGRKGDILAWGLFVLVVVVVVMSVSNGANLTDGLDGLAAGVSAPVAATLMALAYVSGNVIYASYLHIIYIPDIGELVVFMSGFLGALIGFLWFNAYPAKVFMGDTGSLTIGGVLGIYAILVRKELMLPILCGVFLIESLSVIIQVGHFKYTRIKFGEGRRVFLMTPIHHHYQKRGVPEPRLVTRFWIVSILLSVFAILTLKIR